MRIDSLTIRNFKGFEEQTFNFPRNIDLGDDSGSIHIVIGANGTGKTSALEAIGVALGIWHAGAPAAGWRNIYPSEVRLIAKTVGDTTRFDSAESTEIQARGVIGECTALPQLRRTDNGINKL